MLAAVYTSNVVLLFTGICIFTWLPGGKAVCEYEGLASTQSDEHEQMTLFTAKHWLKSRTNRYE